MTDEPEFWDEPRETGNAMLLAGYLCGAMARIDGAPYRVSDIYGGPIIEHVKNGNLYRLRVEQISGTE